MSDFKETIIREFSQGKTVWEEQEEQTSFWNNLDQYWDALFTARTFKEISAELEQKKTDIYNQGVETGVRKIKFDAPEPTAVHDLLSARFYTDDCEGATDITLCVDANATVVVFEAIIYPEEDSYEISEYTKLLAYSITGDFSREHVFTQRNRPVQKMAMEEFNLCSVFKEKIVISVWQEEIGNILCRVSSHVDRLKHAAGGIWVRSKDSAFPIKHCRRLPSFVWYVPANDIPILIDNIQRLDDSTSLDEVITIGSGLLTLGVPIAAAAISGAGTVGTAGSIVLGASAGTGAIIFAVISVALGAGAYLLNELAAFKDDMIKQIRKVAKRDKESQRYENGIRLTVYKKLKDFEVEAWNDDVMEGITGIVGEFAPAPENQSGPFLVPMMIQEDQLDL